MRLDELCTIACKGRTTRVKLSMGQKVGKASFDGRAKPFVNRKCLKTARPSPFFARTVKV